MLTIPMKVSASQYDMVIVLEDENLERLKQHDPGEVHTEKLGPFAKLKLRNLQIAYATPAEVKRLCECKEIGDLAKALNHLARGFSYKPERGDHDGPYQTPAKN